MISLEWLEKWKSDHHVTDVIVNFGDNAIVFRVILTDGATSTIEILESDIANHPVDGDEAVKEGLNTLGVQIDEYWREAHLQQ